MSSELLRKARGGDVIALELLLVQRSPAVLRRIEAEVGSKYQALISADDVLQQAWLEAFLKIDTLEAESEQEFEAWLYRIAHHNHIDAIRQIDAHRRGGKLTRVQVREGTSARTLCEALERIDSGTPSRVVASHETEQILQAVLRTLPPDYQVVVQAYDLDGQSIEEVAHRMGRSQGAIHMLRGRAHDALRTLLAAQLEKSQNSA